MERKSECLVLPAAAQRAQQCGQYLQGQSNKPRMHPARKRLRGRIDCLGLEAAEQQTSVHATPVSEGVVQGAMRIECLGLLAAAQCAQQCTQYLQEKKELRALVRRTESLGLPAAAQHTQAHTVPVSDGVVQGAMRIECLELLAAAPCAQQRAQYLKEKRN
eukprot:1157708-Pelagomonas_calceolata.AAC.1